MNLTKNILLFYIIILSQIIAQNASVSGNVVTRFGRGNQFDTLNNKTDFEYNEILTDIYLYRGNLTGWLQYEYSDPPEYGRDLNTIRRFRLNYKKNNWIFDFGDVYRSWDRGMVLSQFDDQQIDYDNSIRGLGILYDSGQFNVDVIGGYRKQYQSTPFNSDLRKHDESVNHNLIATRLGYNSGDVFSALTLLADNADINIKSRGFAEDKTVAAKNYIAGYSMDIGKPSWDLAFDIIYKNTKIDPDLYFIETDFSDFSLDSIARNSHSGYSFYSIINKYLGNWTVTLDYKKYNLAVMNPDRREAYPYPEGSIIYQNPPLTFIEHSSTLLNRNIHQLDKNDEIGYQLSVNGLINDNVNVLLNLNQGSRNVEWSREPAEIVWQKNPWEKAKTAKILPLTTPAALPFIELYGESIFYLMDDHLTSKIGISQSNQDILLFENLQSDSYDSLSYEFINALTIPFDLSYSFSNGYSLELKYQWQQLEKALKIDVNNDGQESSRQSSSYYDNNSGGEQITKKHQFVTILQLGILKSPHWGLSLSVEKDKYHEFGVNSENIEINRLEEVWEDLGFKSDLTWISAELLFNISSKYRVNLFYGSEKGGLQCRNGVCRVIQPFSDGLRVGLTTTF